MARPIGKGDAARQPIGGGNQSRAASYCHVMVFEGVDCEDGLVRCLHHKYGLCVLSAREREREC